MYLLYFKRLTIINILIRIKTDSFFLLLCIVLLKVTWHTRNLCSAFNPSKVHTHTHQWTHTDTHTHHHGRNHHILWGDVSPPYWKNTNLSPPIICLLYCNMWHMICPPFMNPGCSLVDLLLFPIYFQFRKNKGNKTVWPPPPLDCTLGWARKRRLAASFEKNRSVRLSLVLKWNEGRS